MSSRVIHIFCNERGSFDVQDGERIAHHLTFDEMLGEVTRLTVTPTLGRTFTETPDYIVARLERRARIRSQNDE